MTQKLTKNDEHIDKSIAFYKKIYGCSLSKSDGDSVKHLSIHLDNVLKKMKEIIL